MEYKIFKGRPENACERLPKEIKAYDFLDGLGAEYEGIDHPPFDTMADCSATDELFGVGTVKNLLLCNSQKTEFYLLCMPADKKFKTKELSKQIGSARLSFASAEHMQELLDIIPGSLTVLGLINDTGRRVKLLFDRDLEKSEYIVVHPCINTTSIKLKMSTLTEKILPALGREPIYVTLFGED